MYLNILPAHHPKLSHISAMLQVLILVLVLLLGLLQPLDEGLHVLGEHRAPLGVGSLAVPVEHGVLAHHVVLVERAHDLRKELHELGVLVAGHLDGVDQHQLHLGAGAEGGEELGPRLDLAQGHVDVLLLVLAAPLHGVHHPVPADGDELGVGEGGRGLGLLHHLEHVGDLRPLGDLLREVLLEPAQLHLVHALVEEVHQALEPRRAEVRREVLVAALLGGEEHEEALVVVHLGLAQEQHEVLQARVAQVVLEHRGQEVQDGPLGHH
mmetsp:Transcript_66248/g.209447  ORF Transcript_66248/g.209447 Transcript_66248/m.209447 type:complete len:267 (-) Transcript_66248:605-1405(-)